jgi:hypothetical protein
MEVRSIMFGSTSRSKIVYTGLVPLLAGFAVIVSFCCSGSDKRSAPKSQTDIALKEDFAIADSQPTSEIQLRSFSRTSLKERFLIIGTEIPVVFSNSDARLLLYHHYLVVRSKDYRLEVFRRLSSPTRDTIAISSEDSVLVQDYEEGMHFLGLKEHYFFIDHGTSPNDHDIQAINLSNRDTILTVDYLPPVTLDNSFNLIYYEVIGPASPQNCPEYDKIEANGDPPYIAEKARFNLHSKVRKLLGDRRCFGLQ